MNYKYLLYWTFGLLVYLIIPLEHAQAVGEFRADYDVSYDVAPLGTTIVTQKVTLTNKQTNFYPKEYSIVIDTDKINEVVARDDGGIITPQINQSDGKTQITLTFNQKAVGLGQALTFTLRFQNQDIAQHNGSVWEVNIPGVAADPDLGSYSVTLNVPPSFGPNAYLSPFPADGRRWTKEQMLRGGISAAYGISQIFSVTLSYFLQNLKVTPEAAEVALPPDTSYQRVDILSLAPKPVTVVRDGDGNWLARYQLLPAENVNVKAKMLIETSLTARPEFMEEPPDTKTYTKALDFWQATDPKIISLASRYRTARAIYDYVVATLSYDYNRVSQNPIRKGALSALDAQSQAICMEFTDLFIAISRAAGIPTRENIGFAYTTNTRLRPLSLVSDVLHSWPEYYDSVRGYWVPVDPTWGNTTGGVNYFDKLDFNHIVFAKHGLSSTYPYPAGFYRENGKAGKDVVVEFSNQTIPKSPEKLVSFVNFPKTVTAGFTTTGSVTVESQSGLAVDRVAVNIESPFGFSLTRKENHLPPFAKLSFPLSLTIPGFLTNTTGQIAVVINGQTQNFYFSVRPMYWLVIPAGIFVAGLLCLVWLTFVKLRVWKRRSRT